ncbi:hypothetical protein NQ318_010966 [Aromia moschata]|uniref:Uncharacterized protein n=1 Tax=Aromia moschata TaxID=1265417 RepID=A0AAV8YMU3_9CUCU|nr:hypothetical protein NQ318_010966 [Aromia moschata]
MGLPLPYFRPPPSPYPMPSQENKETQQFLLPPPPQIMVNNETVVSRRNSEHDPTSALSSRETVRDHSRLKKTLSGDSLVSGTGYYAPKTVYSRVKEKLTQEKPKLKNVTEDWESNCFSDSLTIILSALYAKLLVVLGMAFPITEIISNEVQPFFYQGYYLYLYLGSIAFVAYMYASLVREKSSCRDNQFICLYLGRICKEKTDLIKKRPKPVEKYGSFYLRLGAIAFGIGSMVYSGLEFGRYFELKNNPECHSNILQAITPATRMVLTLVQVQFIFLNSKDIEFNRHKIIARFGLMHMIATNLCEWLYVLVEETKHEIIHLQEYSLICAVILFEMWKNVQSEEPEERDKDKEKHKSKSTTSPYKEDKVATHIHFNPFGGRVVSSNHHFTIDCSNAHRGLFAGIMVIVITIISLIMFFVLATSEVDSEERHKMAEFEVNMVELLLYVITTLAVIVAMTQLRKLKYDRKIGEYDTFCCLYIE